MISLHSLMWILFEIRIYKQVVNFVSITCTSTLKFYVGIRDHSARFSRVHNGARLKGN